MPLRGAMSAAAASNSSDDRPVLDELMMQSYVATDASAAIVPCDGTREPHQAELDVQAAYPGARPGSG